MRKKAAPQDLWERAVTSLRAAMAFSTEFPDEAASSAYYAAMYAIESLFLLEGKGLDSHSAVRTALHRDLIKAGRWDKNLGERFDELLRGRETGDYGGAAHISPAEMKELCDAALAILENVHQEHPKEFPLKITKKKSTAKKN